MIALAAAIVTLTQAGQPILLGSRLINPERLLVKLAPIATDAGVISLTERAGARILNYVPEVRWQVVELERSNLLNAFQIYKRSRIVSNVQFDYAKKLAYTPNDELFPDQWHMVRIKADLAWNNPNGRGNPNVKIAVMDTGVQVNHPDLVNSMWTNPGEIPNNGIDDDQNGYIDDVNGYDFAYNDPNPDDQYGHGTSCAGLAAATQDNFIGGSGVAPYCKIVAVKASLDNGYFYDSAIVPALIYVANIGCKVVSMSFYSDGVTPAERDAIDYAWSRGVLPVAAAGNDSQVFPYYPGAYENTLAVAATDSHDHKAGFSNWGTWVDVAAPGTGLTTVALGGGYTGGFGGTSGAAPHAAGLAGLLFGANLSATNAQVRAAIEDTAAPTIQAPYGQYTNYGFINAQASLARILGQTSGSVPPRFLFASPIGGGVLATATNGTVEGGTTPPPGYSKALMIYGVGLETPNNVRVLRNGMQQQLLSQTRNWVTVPIKSNFPATYTLQVNNQTVSSFDFAGGAGLLYSPSDASTKGGGSPVATGGFRELYKRDGLYFTCTKRDDDLIFVQMPIRKVTYANPKRMEISFTRYYQNNTGGQEIIELYDWSTASYPYGGFVTVSDQPISGSAIQTINAVVTANPGRFIDPEGTIYVQIRTSAPGANAQLFADTFRITLK